MEERTEGAVHPSLITRRARRARMAERGRNKRHGCRQCIRRGLGREGNGDRDIRVGRRDGWEGRER